MTVEAQTAQELAPVIDCIHDLWFEVDELKSFTNNTIILHMRKSPRSLASVAVLTIRNAVKLSVVDTERIGSYDINELKYVDGLLEITTGIPLVVKILVSTLDITAEILDDA